MNLVPSFLRRNRPPEAEERSVVSFGSMEPGWYQKALDQVSINSTDITSNTAVYACTNILSQEVASLRLQHWRYKRGKGREQVENSMAVKVMNRPNQYQTRSDFWLYLMRSLLLSGAGSAAAVRNKRDEIIALHPAPPRACQPYVAPSGYVFYSVGSFNDDLFRIESMLPARDLFNPRINCYRHPLIGETPVSAFAFSAATGSALQRFTAKFFQNMSRPSGVLMTPKPLTAAQLKDLREHWHRVTQGDAAGGTPVLHSDLKWQQITMSATDAQTIETYRMTVADVAMAYRVPLFMLGDLSKATFKKCA